MSNEFLSLEYAEFLESLKNDVKKSRTQAARSVNKELIMLYQQIGSRILKQQKQFGWDTKIIKRLSKDLSEIFPEMKGFIQKISSI